MKKIVSILGARPQFIKAGAVSREIQKHDFLNEVLIHTGQHYDANMSDIFFDEMKIPKPNYNLNINGLNHGAMTGQMLEKIEEVLLKEKPDWVMVYGDTNSTIAGALAASKLHIKVAHVEAGLRSFNMKMPEEVNRILTDRISDILFCPTQTAVDNLKSEGYPFITTSGGKQRIEQVGDVMQDGALFYKSLAQKPPSVTIDKNSHYILCTIHRAENTDDPQRLKNIVDALNEIAKDTQIILPLHPRTKKKVEELSLSLESLTIIEPVGYLNMVWLIDHCSMVMTDSGGLQKEAFFFEKPCITLRDETEWIELVKSGYNTLVGANKDKILEGYYSGLKQKAATFKKELYGSGNASKKIIEEILAYE